MAKGAPISDVREISNLAYGFIGSKVLFSALNARIFELLAKFADPSTPYYSLLHPMWATHYGTYDHLARVQEWSLIGDDEEDEISPRVSSRAGP